MSSWGEIFENFFCLLNPRLFFFFFFIYLLIIFLIFFFFFTILKSLILTCVPESVYETRQQWVLRWLHLCELWILFAGYLNFIHTLEMGLLLPFSRLGNSRNEKWKEVAESEDIDSGQVSPPANEFPEWNRFHFVIFTICSLII